MVGALHRATRDELSGLPVDVAPRLLGAELRTVVAVPGEPAVEVRMRLTEVEAYHGQGTGSSPIPAPTPAWGAPPATPRCGASPGISTCI